jgi:hypothetical protein
MADIYRLADRAIIWLGLSTEETDLVITVMNLRENTNWLRAMFKIS